MTRRNHCPKKLAAIMPVKNSSNTTKITPKPGMSLTRENSSASGVGKKAAIASITLTKIPCKIPMPHAMTAMVMMTGTQTKTPVAKYLRIFALVSSNFMVVQSVKRA